MVDYTDIPLIDEGDSAPFSKGLMAQTLMSTGLAPERAYGVAAAVERRLQRRGPAALTLADLHEIARDQLGREQGDVLIARFRQWQKLRRVETPLIILIGGATGVGKSTLATQLAHRLGITRVIGTDMVRQTMRAFFAAELMPAIHTSSFDAASAVRVPVPRETDLSKMGFIEQTKAVSVGIEALIARGIDEAQRMVVEGVHLVPGYLDRSHWGRAIVLEFMLAIADKERHRSNFTVREWETGGIRPLRRYMEHFADIRRIQKYMVGRAQALGVPVIDGPSLDDNLSAVLGTILQRVEDEGGGDLPAGEQAAGRRCRPPPTARPPAGAADAPVCRPGLQFRRHRPIHWAHPRAARPSPARRRLWPGDPSVVSALSSARRHGAGRQTSPFGDEGTGNHLRGMTYSAPEPARTPSSIAPSTYSYGISPLRRTASQA